jgi:hypothetical protein
MPVRGLANASDWERVRERLTDASTPELKNILILITNVVMTRKFTNTLLHVITFNINSHFLLIYLFISVASP